MAKYTVTINSANGADTEIYNEYKDAREALKVAARIGRKTMQDFFGPNDYSRGENWTVTVYVAEDEGGETYTVNMGEIEAPCIYRKEIPVRR